MHKFVFRLVLFIFVASVNSNSPGIYSKDNNVQIFDEVQFKPVFRNWKGNNTIVGKAINVLKKLYHRYLKFEWKKYKPKEIELDPSICPETSLSLTFSKRRKRSACNAEVCQNSEYSEIWQAFCQAGINNQSDAHPENKEISDILNAVLSKSDAEDVAKNKEYQKFIVRIRAIVNAGNDKILEKSRLFCEFDTFNVERQELDTEVKARIDDLKVQIADEHEKSTCKETYGNQIKALEVANDLSNKEKTEILTTNSKFCKDTYYDDVLI